MPEFVTLGEFGSLLNIVEDCVVGKSLDSINVAAKRFGHLIGADKLYWAAPMLGNDGTFAPTPVSDSNILAIQQSG